MKEIGTDPSVGCVLHPDAAGVPSLACLADVAMNVINAAFIFLGVACLIYLLYGALLFVLSRGDQKALQKARGTMTYAIIGTVVVAMSFALLNTVTMLLGISNSFLEFRFYQP